MIKKVSIASLVLLFLLTLSSAAYCEDNALKKLGRGFCNVITSPFEIFEQMSRTNEYDGAWAAWTAGLLKGIGMTGVRAVVGVYEVATFPIPLPRYYKPILKDPEFFFENQNW